MSRKTPEINAQQLESLLVNWGAFVMTGSWGPSISSECGSCERQWNANPSRYVWEGGKPQRLHDDADDALGALVERVLEGIPMDWRRVLLQRYGYRREGYKLAVALNTSVRHADALLVSARAYIVDKLESMQ